LKDLNRKIQKVLEELIRHNTEIGLQVAAYLGDEVVVDAWAGLMDESNRQHVSGETLFNSFSISKGIVSTCIHILADRGLLDYGDPIAYYWPEFAAGGKEKATIFHALTHRAGIPDDPPNIDIELMSNWGEVCKTIAGMKAKWEPGTKISYHPLTYGWILGELVNRIDGRSISQFLRDEICQPLGIEDIYFGVIPEKEHLVATLKNAPGLSESLIDFGVAESSPMSDLAGTFNKSKIKLAPIPGAGAIVNARSLARHYAMLACDGKLDGVRVLSKERIAIASARVAEDSITADIRWWNYHSLGYTLGGGPGLRKDLPHSFGYEGVGTIGFADPDRNFAFAMLKNLLDLSSPNEMVSATRILQAVMEALKIK
jgi:CubicO group peptidase (beta-lactamase class C family)